MLNRAWAATYGPGFPQHWLLIWKHHRRKWPVKMIYSFESDSFVEPPLFDDWYTLTHLYRDTDLVFRYEFIATRLLLPRILFRFEYQLTDMYSIIWSPLIAEISGYRKRLIPCSHLMVSIEFGLERIEISVVQLWVGFLFAAEAFCCRQKPAKYLLKGELKSSRLNHWCCPLDALVTVT